MLSVRVQNDYEIKLSLQEMAQPALDGFAFAEISFMNDDFTAGFTGAFRRLIGRSIIDDKNIVQLLPGSADDVSDVFLFVVRRNDRRKNRHRGEVTCKAS